MIFKELISKLNIKLGDFVAYDEKRVNLQYTVVYCLLGAVAAVMTILNIFTHKGALTLATGVFSLLCIVNFVLHHLGKGFRIFAKYAFMVELLVLFSFFLISGNPEGFSAIWIILLPSCALLLYQMKEGSVLSLAMLLIIIFLLRTPLGNTFLKYDYTSSFLQRFPILYTAAFLLALFLEVIRQKTFDNYQFLIAHDPLTGALNRRGFFEMIEKQMNASDSSRISFVIMDLDHFKAVNDTYGHDAGDAVLKCSVERIKQLTGLPVCRWGGEEFAIFDSLGMFNYEYANDICRKFGELVVDYNGIDIPVHISIGAVSTVSDKILNIVQLSKYADECLYEAKESGRNRAVAKVI